MSCVRGRGLLEPTKLDLAGSIPVGQLASETAVDESLWRPLHAALNGHERRLNT